MHNSSLIRPHFVWFVVVALLALVAARAQENETDDATLAAKVAKGRSQYLAGENEMAEETFREVERADPGNPEADEFLKRIARDRLARGELHRERTRAQLLNEVTQSWERPGVLRGSGDDAQTKSPTAPLVQKLNEIVLPTVSFTRAEIAQVVAALSAASEEFDATSVLPKGVNIVLLDPANRAPTVTLTLRNAPLKRVLDFVAESIGYQYEVQADAVVLRPGGETTMLDTEFFPVTRATVLRMTGNTLAISPSAARAEAFSSAGASNDAGPASNAAEGEAMKNFLQQAGVNFEAVAGSSLAYDGSALIVTQTSRNVERIRNILARYN
ncbi:MAG TPA: hypothetical protein VEA63_08345, partial [Opitutus sp.]|nr:hypothetical protein [Opitutus sp.]